ncbi:lysophospholipid acyltransferase family protein [Treponema sp.]|uniref:lysophospholipid acyltransferase family protein n=1 Tax=Treponema sp. TaxID=166 RepID=UPI00298DB0DB|nr:lysophospholipid acyltransferase family protein [Treponema sp.]MCQ2241685.1 1-acyl-sn-glycerol-3-phosphate acyltransferase [Treponema sp.]
MIRTIFRIIKVICWMLIRGKWLRLAKKYDRQGNIEARDKIVHEKVPLWARYVVQQCPAEVEVIGEEKIPQDRAVVFIANHQSNMDIPVLLGYIDKLMCFVAKAELSKIPLLYDWMKMLQCTFMDRKSPRSAVKAMHDAVDGLKKGYSQMIFPEGTRSRGGEHHEFKAGSFKLAFMAEATIVPVTIDGTWRLLEEKGVMSKGKVTVTIHDPIVTAGMSKDEMKELPPKIEQICCAALPPPRELPAKKRGLF